MDTTTQKIQILQSLQDLDDNQTQKVLKYIQHLDGNKSRHRIPSINKGEAMTQIRQALTQNSFSFRF